jgi:hypothetical protein
MKFDMMLFGSGNFLDLFRKPRNDLHKLIQSSSIGNNDYGSSLRMIYVTIVFQDGDFWPLKTMVSRKHKKFGTDVSLSEKWALQDHSDKERMVALLDCLINACTIAGEKMTRKGDDFNANALIMDLHELSSKIGVTT